MRANQVAEEERVIKPKLAKLDANSARKATVAVADAYRQRFANMILNTEMRLPVIALLPLVGEDQLSVEKRVSIRHPDVPIRRNRFLGSRLGIPSQGCL